MTSTTKAELREALRRLLSAVRGVPGMFGDTPELNELSYAESHAADILARPARITGYAFISDGDLREEFRVPDFGTAEECRDAANEAAENWGGRVVKLVVR